MYEEWPYFGRQRHRRSAARVSNRAVMVSALAAVLLIGFVATPSFAARDGRSENLRVRKVDTSNHPLVSVDVIPPWLLSEQDLSAKDFQVSQVGGVRSVTVTPLRKEPLEAVFVVDTSVHEEDLRAAQAAVVEALLRLPPDARVTVLSMALRERQTEMRLSAPTEAIQEVARLRPQPPRKPKNALIGALRAFSRNEDARRVVIGLAMGSVSEDATALRGMAERFLRANASLHAAVLTDGEPSLAVTEELAKMASRTGGSVKVVGDRSRLVSAYDSFTTELQAQYRLTFRLRRGQPAEITVRVSRAGITASTALRLDSGPSADSGLPVLPQGQPPQRVDPLPNSSSLDTLVRPRLPPAPTFSLDDAVRIDERISGALTFALILAVLSAASLLFVAKWRSGVDKYFAGAVAAVALFSVMQVGMALFEPINNEWSAAFTAVVEPIEGLETYTESYAYDVLSRDRVLATFAGMIESARSQGDAVDQARLSLRERRDVRLDVTYSAQAAAVTVSARGARPDHTALLAAEVLEYGARNANELIELYRIGLPVATPGGLEPVVRVDWFSLASLTAASVLASAFAHRVTRRVSVRRW